MEGKEGGLTGRRENTETDECDRWRDGWIDKLETDMSSHVGQRCSRQAIVTKPHSDHYQPPSPIKLNLMMSLL